jgi:hypothetical protein
VIGRFPVLLAKSLVCCNSVGMLIWDDAGIEDIWDAESRSIAKELIVDWVAIILVGSY